MDITNHVFGFLTAIEPVRIKKKSQIRKMWMCKCVCGNNKIIDESSLVGKRTTSCGCKRLESISKATTKHGMSNSKPYHCWQAMLQRCNDSSSSGFYLYGGRGIKVCKEWKDFINFYNDMGEPNIPFPTVERIDVNKNYEPSNCRWASKKEQANNTRRNVFLEHNGKRMTIQQWAEYLAIPHDRIRGRLRLGFTTEEALSLTNNNFGKRQSGIRRGK